jgi:MoxR-like ATPase
MVMATQTPVETEGTYPLPEAQLDRFFFKIQIEYPSRDDEIALVVRATANQTGDSLPLDDVRSCMDGSALSAIQALAACQRVDEQVVDYAVRIVRATRGFAGLAVGSGPRGTLALVRGARAVALLDGREYVTPDDVKRVALPALRHRVALMPDALLEGRSANDILTDVLGMTAAPRV